MWLAHNRGMYSSMGLVDRVAHSRGIAVLDDLVVGLVSGSSGQESRDSDKSLEKGTNQCQLFSESAKLEIVLHVLSCAHKPSC